MSPPTTPPTALLFDDDDYNSADDDDFDPTTAAAADDALSSDSDSSRDSPRRKKRKRRASSADEGGEGGLIKTRAQRAWERQETQQVVLTPQTGEDAQDVEELWKQMNSKPAPAPPQEEEREKKDNAPEVTAEGEETVTISRTYTFAGATHTELKTVPRSSQEAQTYLSNLATTTAAPAPDPALPPRRAPPKKRASVFDAAAAARKPVGAAPAAKLNTLEKSRLDWAGFVDKEGIGEELKKHTRGDKAYLDRQAFLGRVEEKRDKAWKEGQKK